MTSPPVRVKDDSYSLVTCFASAYTSSAWITCGTTYSNVTAEESDFGVVVQAVHLVPTADNVGMYLIQVSWNFVN